MLAAKSLAGLLLLVLLLLVFALLTLSLLPVLLPVPSVPEASDALMSGKLSDCAGELGLSLKEAGRGEGSRNGFCWDLLVAEELA